MTTTIAWTDETWNPIRGARWVDTPAGATFKRGWHCERVSPGCVACYAERQNATMARGGTGLAYTRKSRDLVDLYLDEKTLMAPLHWRKPRRVFPCSMTDLFGEWVPDEWLDRIFAVMALTPQHTYQVLTKRSARMREYLGGEGPYTRTKLGITREVNALRPPPPPRHWYHAPRSLQWPLPNVWIGVSAEDQERADERIPDLLATPAAVRWISVEPMLGPITMWPWLTGMNLVGTYRDEGGRVHLSGPVSHDKGGLDWIVCGGESGPGARAFDLAWARSLRDQCAAAGVAFFMKQTGENAFDTSPGTAFSLSAYRKRKSRHGEDPAEWPADLRVREWPGVKA